MQSVMTPVFRMISTAATRPQILNIAQRIRKGTGDFLDSLTPGPVRIMRGDLIGQVTGGTFGSKSPNTFNCVS